MCFFIKQRLRKHVKNVSHTVQGFTRLTLLHETLPKTRGKPNAGSPAVIPTQGGVSQSLQLLHESSSRAVGRKLKRLCHFPLHWIYVGFLFNARSVIEPRPGFQNANILRDSHGSFQNLIRDNAARWSFFLVCVVAEIITLLLFTIYAAVEAFSPNNDEQQCLMGKKVTTDSTHTNTHTNTRTHTYACSCRKW